ncbi:Stage II sporulation protein M [Sporobacter termitidis DSM 10068]|uniref:Stage II sporulation protein M n=1 Tax=Sporobacter termitidis DSM 10068 TaxID=1123282 RepID=A0A1M5TF81_9FIRM|nr:stage II sporulation protein M [Sporobacter termitidis]SHH49417.1 Stage II sporulation protein M [Sporobacter termitidis DSM 10068]
MNKRFFVISLHDESFSRAGLVLCGVLFLCGCIAGTVTAGFVNDGTRLNNYFSSFMSFFLTGNSVKRDFFSAVIDTFKYNLLAIALGFSVIGVFFLPVLSAFRGFFLSFSAAMVVRVLGGKGVALALAIFGANTLITIPCFFVLSVDAFSASLAFFRIAVFKSQKAGASPFNSRFFARCGICLAVLLAAALIDLYVTPHLISYAASRI